MTEPQKHMNHDPCENCGFGRCHHKREKVFPDGGPSGSYHYEYTDGPVGNGGYR